MTSESFAPVRVSFVFRVPRRKGLRACGMRDSAAFSGRKGAGEPRSRRKRQGPNGPRCATPAGAVRGLRQQGQLYHQPG
eukprot:6180711-Pleurochrysis_carterae.AAC.5